MNRAFITYTSLLISGAGFIAAAMYVYSSTAYLEAGFPMAIAFVGIGTTFIGITGVQKERRELAKYRELSKRSKVRLPVTEVRRAVSEINQDMTVHVIVCKVLDTRGKVLSEFTSEPLRRDPAKALAKRKEIDVYVDPCDVKNYYMDVSFL